ncbi:glycogen synthase GlgA [Polyangium sp. 6x1]|uniref:glycogen synthase GlgA n=1 Tax=Polyangium sp. 6x1 TaxID=3042689 RepID=UPI002482DD5B|nr:glycogen synthase GlgA [Polyangium sp. 6x1]MDI1443032.1 glycogen synthase GlgA [Polyangium sp. 6x1]
MDILFAATELFPLLKVGGLADYASALPHAVRSFGHRFTLVLPRFRSVDTSALRIVAPPEPMRVKLGQRSFDVTLVHGRLDTGMDVLLLDAPELFDRAGVYGESGKDYADNGLRFALFSRTVAEIALRRAQSGSAFDVVHVNDWHAALTTTFLEDLRNEEPRLEGTRSLLTIHNLAHQGVFERALFRELGLGRERYSIDGIEFYGNLNFLKQGILSADAITTVSETYAREIRSPAFGCGLEGVLQRRASVLRGVTNGIDEQVWNPSTDSALPVRYDADDVSQRARCRAALQEEVGLPVDATRPLLGSIGRIVPQKGSDVLAAALPELVHTLGAQVIIAGDGDPALMKEIAAAADGAKGAVAFVHFASEELVHRIFAGVDLMLLPSRFEPCGLVQMYAQRYGALPVARATGGFVDTIDDCTPALDAGTGFLFDECRADAMIRAVARAVEAKKSPQWPVLVARAMRLEHGWSTPARRYDEIYRAASGGAQSRVRRETSVTSPS